MFELTMTAGNKVHGTKAAGAPFNVYLRKAAAGNGMQAATYAVKPGDTLHKQFPLSLFANAKYSIDVHGPNGFYRSFHGDPASRQVQVHTEYEAVGTRLTGNMRVHLRNAGNESLTAEIYDNSYHARRGGQNHRRGAYGICHFATAAKSRLVRLHREGKRLRSGSPFCRPGGNRQTELH